MNKREQLKRLLSQTPFRPFTVELDNDAAFSIPSADHASVVLKTLVVAYDDDTVELVSIPHITRIKLRTEDLPPLEDQNGEDFPVQGE